MTKEELAEALNGCRYRNEIGPELEAAAKEAADHPSEGVGQ